MPSPGCTLLPACLHERPSEPRAQIRRRASWVRRCPWCWERRQLPGGALRHRPQSKSARDSRNRSAQHLPQRLARCRTRCPTLRPRSSGRSISESWRARSAPLRPAAWAQTDPERVPVACFLRRASAVTLSAPSFQADQNEKTADSIRTGSERRPSAALDR